ncbi:MAG: UDP-N-acetylmuramate--alanine ligase [Flavobacterium sp. MedPE-SWcel]|uniref:gamma-glutamylcyclotransferase family protein n=1 Tax=uncultured Flavobacterium sp. TaxID=165435 RepID=UPI00091DE3ED|nr:gamma-glutamylcyclotransferase family protein [uncultured Flavobacterium sp.]OIQ21028.1 MAG: UDP-N-acetylmuramate--alanine ligase [Flavobacterium sp. MedPE-SWcel]
MKHYLFSYGTLQLEQVQIATYGRVLSGSKDILKHYKLENLKITDQAVLEKNKQQFYPIAIKTNNPNDSIKGIIFEITEQELIETDKYEVSDYKRVSKVFESGKKAWVYINR